VLLSPRGDLDLEGAGGASRTLELETGLTGASIRASTGGGALTVMGFWPSWESACFNESADQPTLLGGELNFSMSSSIVMMGPGGGESAGGVKCLLGLSTSI
jgi:hypothetical protein